MSAPGVRTGLAERLSLRAIPALGSTAIDALMATVRWEIAGAEHYRGTWGAGRPTVFVLWHGHLLPGAYYHRGQGLATLISQHRDGEYIARVVQGWGFTVVRGSSTRGGKEALVEIVRVLRRGQAVAITPDGPRGPRQQLKPGALVAPQRAGVPVVPVAAGTDRGWYFGGWDRFLVPKPFAHIRLVYGAPMLPPVSGTEAAVEAFAHDVEARLRELTRAVQGADAEPASS